MNPTIKDVLAHPAIKRLVFTKNRTEIERMRDILQVLQLYDKLQEMYKTHELTELTTDGSTDGFLHFKECPWTDGVDGPDTCVCSYVKSNSRKIIDILNKLDLVNRNERLKTFQKNKWPLASPSPEELADDGFFYFGDSDKVRCSFCGVEIGKWDEKDNPTILHKKLSPSCPNIRRRRKYVSI